MTISSERNISKNQPAVMSTSSFDKKSSKGILSTKTSTNQSKLNFSSDAEVQTNLSLSSAIKSSTQKFSSVGTYSSTNESLNRNQFQRFVRQITVKPLLDIKKSS